MGSGLVTYITPFRNIWKGKGTGIRFFFCRTLVTQTFPPNFCRAVTLTFIKEFSFVVVKTKNFPPAAVFFLEISLSPAWRGVPTAQQGDKKNRDPVFRLILDIEEVTTLSTIWKPALPKSNLIAQYIFRKLGSL